MSLSPLRMGARYWPTEPGEVLRLLGASEEDSALRRLAESQLEVVDTFVFNYTRGNGFQSSNDETRPWPCRALRSVIHQAAARGVANPQQIERQTAGAQSINYGTAGQFTLAELTVLNSFRRRTA